MSMDFEQKPDLNNIITESSKIQDLIFMLKSAFHPKDFSKVEEILVVREKKISEEIGHWKREYDLMEKKHGEAIVGQLFVDEEMSKYKRKLGALEDQVTRLEEDKMLDSEKVRVLDEREKRARAMYEKLLEDFERVERENRDLVVKKAESDSARVKAERELESVKKKNGEFDLRITRLEGEVELLMSQRRKKFKVEEEKDSTDATSVKEAPVGSKSDNSTEPVTIEVISNGRKNGNSSAGADSVDTRANGLNVSGFVINPCSEGIPIQNETVERGNSSLREKHQETDTAVRKAESEVVIELSDSDDEMPTQDQTCNVPIVAVPDVSWNAEEIENIISEQPDGRNQSASGSKRKRSPFVDVGEGVNDCNDDGASDWSISSSDSDSGSCDTSTINGLIAEGSKQRLVLH